MAPLAALGCSVFCDLLLLLRVLWWQAERPVLFPFLPFASLPWGGTFIAARERKSRRQAEGKKNNTGLSIAKIKVSIY